MLSSLRIRDLAIIEDLELTLGPGLNVLTGETGAGKSIVVSALELALGGKGSSTLVRTGCTQAEVEALFEQLEPGTVAATMAELGLRQDAEAPSERPSDTPCDEPAQLVIRRVLTASGRSRAYVNGRLVTTSQLKRVAQGLVDISSQHEHHTLTNPTTHLLYLDAYAALGERRACMQRAYEAVRRSKAALQAFHERVGNHEASVERLRSEIGELEGARLTIGEDRQLSEECQRLRNATALLQLAGSASELLYEQDGSLMDLLLQARRAVLDAERLDASLAPVQEGLDVARRHIEEVARELRRYVDSLSVRPDELALLEERLHALSRLKRKYGGSLEGALLHLERARGQLESSAHQAETADELKAAYEQAMTDAFQNARELSRRRKLAAEGLGQAIADELRSLGMGDARVLVEVAPLDGSQNGVELNGAGLCPNGIDRAEFLIAPNVGEQARPLATVASGGELSRAMLAIKRVLADVGPAGMYVFDEVDTGVGGATAEVIGQKIQCVARHRQVLCITHLAQIAVYADQHFLVSKIVSNGRTQTQLTQLSRREQTEEVARMLGGIQITKYTRAAAREMLRVARVQAA